MIRYETVNSHSERQGGCIHMECGEIGSGDRDNEGRWDGGGENKEWKLKEEEGVA
jgi:hypothetical protein